MIQEKDFIEVEYTGKIKDGNIVFDTTSKEAAEAAGILNQNVQYKPMIICVGKGHILKGIDKALIGKEVGKEYTIEITPEDGFGKKRGDLLQLIATPKFRKHGINPMPGLQVNIDNTVGIIKTVTGGRTLVDFNHPCAGKDLVYIVKVKRIVTDAKEKVQALLSMLLGEQMIEKVDVQEKENEKIAIIKTKIELPKELQEKITENIKASVPEIINVQYEGKKEGKEESKILHEVTE